MSIRKRLFLGISTFILIFVIIAFGAFVVFMPNFVENSKQEEMIAVARQIKNASSQDALDLLVSDISGSTDISVVMETDMVSGNMSGNGHGRGAGRNITEGMGGILDAAASAGSQDFFVVEHRALNTPFMIYKDYSELSQTFYVMRPMQSIDDVVGVAKEFFSVIAIFAILSGLGFSYVYSKRFVKPILTLNEIAGHMAQLDFTHIYTDTGRDEIGELGRSINHLSEQLDRALKDLEDELQHKERLNQLQKRFLADASHELKTPLAIIMGNMEQLSDSLVEEEGRDRYYQTIINELEHMNRVIHDLLKLSELESAPDALNIQNEDMASVIDDVLFAYSEIIRNKEIEIEYDIPETMPVRMDGKHMETVMRNVIGNALKHCPEGAVVSVGAAYDTQGLTLQVFNTSMPIPSERLATLFDRFSKYEGVSNGHGQKSTGLGLAIVKRILDLHGFKYEMKNASGGVTFMVTLPSENLIE